MNINSVIAFVLSFLHGTQFENIANDIQADIASGKITLGEVETFIVDALSLAEKYLPKDTAVFEDFKALLPLLVKTVTDFEALNKPVA